MKLNQKIRKSSDPLYRFLKAQKSDYLKALSEIKEGKKIGHWMWFIFPQIAGFGKSTSSNYYAIHSLTQAGDYLNHPVLGKRLVEICQALCRWPNHNATAIFGSPDELKLKSSMTLFAVTRNAHPISNAVLQKYFSGKKR